VEINGFHISNRPTRWVERSVNGISWKVRSDFLLPLIHNVAPRLSKGVIIETPLRENAFRIVFRLQIPNPDKLSGQNLVVKEYRWPTWKNRLKYLFRRSKGHREWERTEEARARGIPVPEILALGEKRRLGLLQKNFLITKELENTQTLGEFLFEQLPHLEVEERERLLKRAVPVFAKFVARLHARGLAHRDFHPGNVLVSWKETIPSFYLLDLDQARIGRSLSPRARVRNLVRLNRSFWTSSLATRARFLRAYLKEIPQLSAKRKKFARQIERQTESSVRSFYRRRDRRCMTSNKYFDVRSLGGIRWHILREFETEDLLDVLARPENALERGSVLKWGNTNQVVELALKRNSAKTVLKRMVISPQKKHAFWKKFPGRCKAVRVWRLANAFLSRNLPTPKPVAEGCLRRLGFFSRSYFITEKIPKSRHLGEWLASEPAPGPKQELTRRLARLFARVHKMGFDHRDLKVQNFLVQEMPKSPPSIYCLDFEGVRFRRRVPLARVIQNLSRLNASVTLKGLVTRTDRLRFLKAYMGRLSSDRKLVRRIWQLTRKRTRQKLLAALKKARY